MIDRHRRDRLAELLRQFVDGLMTNDDFEDRLDRILDDPRPVRKWEDKALWAIRSRAWFLYDDLRTHRMTGQWALSPEGHREIARWIVFLHSDCEYRWPVTNFISLSGCLFGMLTFGLGPRLYGAIMRRRVGAMGDWDVWPFICREDYERALQQPRLLTGKA